MDGVGDLLAKPVCRMNATIQTAGRENHQEIGSFGDATQQGLIEIAFVQIDDVQKDAQAALHQFFAQEERGGIATLAPIADEDVVLQSLAGW